MCGIGGISRRPGTDVDMEAVLADMLRVQLHRGPDHQGAWVAADCRVGLCHTRLSIVDLSKAGHQPMQTADGNYAISFNGEIYNWRELRESLARQGSDFRTHSDTEVVLEAYRHYGTAMLEHLRGMFAFALYDRRQNVVFCARDRVGKKPFVYTEFPGGVAFASEIPALYRVPGCDTAIDHSALATMLLHNLRHVPDPHTAYRGIRRLRPGHAMIIKNGEIERSWRYWDPLPAPCAATPESIREVLEESVRLRMAADVPVGALLSGGVDSSAIVNLMCRFGKSPVRTYALGFDERDEDLRRAREMARVLGCEHREFYFDGKRQFEVFNRVIQTYGEPIMLLPLVHTFELCEAIRADGMKVVMAGHGADELFYGYTGHARTALISDALRWGRLAVPLARLVPARYRTGALALAAAPPGRRKAALYQGYAAQLWPSLMNPESLKGLQNVAQQEFAYWGEVLTPDAYIDESNFLALISENAHSVTIAADLPAMMASIEMRAPFLDQCMIAQALSVSYRRKVAGKRWAPTLKWILKQAVDDLVPHELVHAPKRGFGSGIQERDVLLGPWKRIGDELFNEPDDADGLFDRRAIRTAWRQHGKKGGAETQLVAKLFSMQLWLQTQREGPSSSVRSTGGELLGKVA